MISLIECQSSEIVPERPKALERKAPFVHIVSRLLADRESIIRAYPHAPGAIEQLADILKIKYELEGWDVMDLNTVALRILRLEIPLRRIAPENLDAWRRTYLKTLADLLESCRSITGRIPQTVIQ